MMVEAPPMTSEAVQSPKQRYQMQLESGVLTPDLAQAQAVDMLDELYGRILANVNAKKSLLPWRRKVQPEMGLYFWGGVGRGKTHLLDLFADSFEKGVVLRVHFHRFMYRVHTDLRRLQGHKNPLKSVAREIADEARVLCFDEFFVTDIGDAMILAGLMEALFELGITLVATSNIVPERLYEDGLQRQRFLPAIALLERRTKVFNLDSGVDYRLRTLQKLPLYHCPHDQVAEVALRDMFNSLAPLAPELSTQIAVNGRKIPVLALADDVVWFSFNALCDGPRSQNDYIELARIYHTVLISGVPVFDGRNDDQARRFINLVDEFYDRGVKLVLSADAGLLELYKGTRLEFVFERTYSRLQEMQSEDYLAEPHKP
jgi:cell division protein ZapE